MDFHTVPRASRSAYENNYISKNLAIQFWWPERNTLCTRFSYWKILSKLLPDIYVFSVWILNTILCECPKLSIGEINLKLFAVLSLPFGVLCRLGFIPPFKRTWVEITSKQILILSEYKFTKCFLLIVWLKLIRLHSFPPRSWLVYLFLLFNQCHGHLQFYSVSEWNFSWFLTK